MITSKEKAPKQEVNDARSAVKEGGFGQWLLSQRKINTEDLTDALDEQRSQGGRLGEVLLKLQRLNEADMLQALAQYLNIDYMALDDTVTIDIETARALPEGIARRFCVLPIGQTEKKTQIIMADPLDVVAIDTVMMRLQRPIQPLLGSRQQILNAIEKIFHGSHIEERQLRDLMQVEAGDEAEFEDRSSAPEPQSMQEIQVEQDAQEAPVVRFVDLLLRQAVKSHASDIHIEPQEGAIVVRMRVDGKLREMVPPSNRMRDAVVARVKILAGMDIAEKRLPQDGRLQLTVSERAIDVRVSVLPTIHGEKVVMRILDAQATCHDIDHLGFNPRLMTTFKEMLARPHGIIIVTGPTGSGKSTTLYSALNYLRNPTKNITTVENPVEYKLFGINQIQIKPDIGLDFAATLRSILRQDPDIILIGEIRDRETIDIAIKASLTGHLVLSTFHTNDAPSAISRMSYMGVERYLLASTLNMVIAQRLVRRICEHCKEPIALEDEVINRLGLTPTQLSGAQVSRGRGCATCGGTGYSGRLPIFEFMPVDPDMEELIVKSATESQLRSCSRSKGWGGLLHDGVQRMLDGLTTAEEVMAVAFTGQAMESQDDKK
ncbi:GspE/PulE family protein [Planctomycetota bacterium]